MKQYPFSFEDLAGKTVEYEIHGRGTHYGRLHPKILNDGSVEPTLEIDFSGDQKPIAPKTLDPKHLRKHPFPARAEYLWAEELDYIVNLIRADQTPS
jgi:hypothetical protein